MPTTTKSGTSTTTTTTPSSPSAQDLADQLATSQSSTIYVDAPEMTDDAAATLLLGDPPLHVEHDAVRDKWAVRKATDQEVADAKAAEEAEASTSTSSTSSSSSSTSSV